MVPRALVVLHEVLHVGWSNLRASGAPEVVDADIRVGLTVGLVVAEVDAVDVAASSGTCSWLLDNSASVLVSARWPQLRDEVVAHWLAVRVGELAGLVLARI